MEQIYGYMVRESKKYGVLTTMNGWLFMYREDKGNLWTTGLFPGSQEHPQPTIREMLYYISALAVAHPSEDETDENGNRIRLQAANAKRPDAAPRLPPPTDQSPIREPSKSARHHTRSQGHRRVLTLQATRDFPDLLFEPSVPGKQIGHKTFFATFMPENRVVVGKFWDSWKETSDARDNEVEIYMQLQAFWGTIIPRFLGCAEYEWHYTMFIEPIWVTPFRSFSEKIRGIICLLRISRRRSKKICGLLSGRFMIWVLFMGISGRRMSWLRTMDLFVLLILNWACMKG